MNPEFAIPDLSKWSSRPFCGLCGANGPLHRHHKLYRSHGGSDHQHNLVILCDVCHGAVHGETVVRAGHRCATCKVLAAAGCYFGERVTNRPVVTSPPWDVNQFRGEE